MNDRNRKPPLAKCPCGKTPKALLPELPPPPAKYGRVVGACCGTWGIEFFNAYKSGEETLELATLAWNRAPR